MDAALRHEIAQAMTHEATTGMTGIHDAVAALIDAGASALTTGAPLELAA